MADERQDPFGLRIQQAREGAGMSLEALGARVGKSSQTIRRYELGEQRPSFQTVERIAEVLGRSLAYFAGLPEPTSKRRRSSAPDLPAADPILHDVRSDVRRIAVDASRIDKTLARIVNRLRTISEEQAEILKWVQDQTTAAAVEQAKAAREGARGGRETPKRPATRASSAASVLEDR